MPMTDEHGDPIPEGSALLPTHEATQALRDQADALQSRLEALGAALGPLVDVEARVKALESVFVPPDPTSPARMVFENRLQRARIDVLGGIAKAVHDAQEAAKEAALPRLQVASTSDVLATEGKVYRG